MLFAARPAAALLGHLRHWASRLALGRAGWGDGEGAVRVAFLLVGFGCDRICAAMASLLRTTARTVTRGFGMGSWRAPALRMPAPAAQPRWPSCGGLMRPVHSTGTSFHLARESLYCVCTVGRMSWNVRCSALFQRSRSRPRSRTWCCARGGSGGRVRASIALSLLLFVYAICCLGLGLALTRKYLVVIQRKRGLH